MTWSEQTINVKVTDLLHILALSGFAVSQPFYSLVASDVTFLLAQEVGRGAIILLVLLVSFVIPILLFLPVVVFRLFSQRLSKVYFLLIVVILASLIFLPVIKNQLDLGPYSQLATAALMGSGIGFVYHRYQVARFYLTCLSFTAVVFPLWFLFATPVSSLFSSSQSQIAGFENNGTNIVLIVFDELPLTSLMTTSGSIDELKFPNFAYLANTSHWFRNASTVSYHTDIAVPALLSGQYPKFQKGNDGALKAPVPSSTNYPKSLFSLVQDRYETTIFESITQLEPEQNQTSPRVNFAPLATRSNFWLDCVIIYLNIVLPENLIGNLPRLEGQWTNFTNFEGTTAKKDLSKPKRMASGGRAKRVYHFIDSIKSTGRPQLFYLHTQLPHVPLVYLPSGKYYGPVETFPHGMTATGWNSDPWEATQAYKRHLLQLAYIDKLLGEILEALKSAKLFDESIVIVTSDHGESFKENTHPRSILPSNVEDTLLVPLFVKLPQQSAGVTSDRNVENIDILPTLSQLIESENDWSFDGLDLFSNSDKRSEKTVFYHTGKVRTFDSADINIEKSLQRKAELFGEGGIDEIYRQGPNNHLLMKNVSELVVLPQAAEIVHVANFSDYLSVNLSSAVIPALLSGQFESDDLDFPLDLAIVLNGVVANVTCTYSNNNHEGNFTALIPESFFIDGSNEVSIYIVNAEDDKSVLQATLIE